MWFNKQLTEADLDRIASDFADSARIAKEELNFDAVELHCGHGYLLSQFLSPSHNRRMDAWGGDRERRFAFPLRVLKEIRARVGEFPIIVKINVDDGFDSGLTLDDACAFAVALEKAGCDLLVPSCGYVDRNGFYMLRGKTPLWAMAKAIPGVTEKIAIALFGKWLVPTVPFREQFLRAEADAVLAAVSSMPVALIGGCRTWSAMEDALGKGFSAIQMARTLIREPDFVNKIKASVSATNVNSICGNLRGGGEEAAAADVMSTCTNCNACVVSTLSEGVAMRCPLRDVDIEDLAARDSLDK